MLSRLVGLTGAAGAGKDTVAGMLVEHGYTHYAMAHPLKAALLAVGIVEPARELKELPLPGKPFSFRKAAQSLGTEWARNLDPDFWANLARANLREGCWVISDIRFLNEVAMVKDLGGVIWHLEGRADVLLGDTATHISTQKLPIDAGDTVLLNNSTFQALKERVATLLLKG